MTRRLGAGFAVMLAGAFAIAALDARTEWPYGLFLLAASALIIAVIAIIGDDADRLPLFRKRSR